MKVFIHSLNTCGMRNAQVGQYRAFIDGNGHTLVESPDEADTILVWSCGFRGDVRDNTLGEIRTLEDQYDARVVVAGCVPDIDGKILAENFDGEVVPWKQHETRMEALFGTGAKRLKDSPRELVRPQLYSSEARFREENPGEPVPYIGRYTQVYIAEGCPLECTYCSERLAFPPFHSYSESDIVAATRAELERTGNTDVVLLADSVGHWGMDTERKLPDLVRALQNEIPNIRIAMQDMNPICFLDYEADFVEFLKAGLIAHLQVPIQSASDRILKLMKRPYKKVEIEQVFRTLSTSGFTELDTHQIVGFPGETEAEFQETVDFILRHHPKYALCNSYMEAQYAPSAKLPGKVDEETKRERIGVAAAAYKRAGIICNHDGSDLARERLRAMSLPSEQGE